MTGPVSVKANEYREIIRFGNKAQDSIEVLVVRSCRNHKLFLLIRFFLSSNSRKLFMILTVTAILRSPQGNKKTNDATLTYRTLNCKFRSMQYTSFV